MSTKDLSFEDRYMGPGIVALLWVILLGSLLSTIPLELGTEFGLFWIVTVILGVITLVMLFMGDWPRRIIGVFWGIVMVVSFVIFILTIVIHFPSEVDLRILGFLILSAISFWGTFLPDKYALEQNKIISKG